MENTDTRRPVGGKIMVGKSQWLDAITETKK